MEDIVGEVGVVVRKGAADIVAPVAAALHKVLEFRHDDIIAAVAVDGLSQAIVHFFPAVKTEDDVVTFLVGEIDDLVVKQHAVGGEGKAEVLALFLFDAPAVSDGLFDDVKVHQRLSAEEIDL